MPPVSRLQAKVTECLLAQVHGRYGGSELAWTKRTGASLLVPGCRAQEGFLAGLLNVELDDAVAELLLAVLLVGIHHPAAADPAEGVQTAGRRNSHLKRWSAWLKLSPVRNGVLAACCTVALMRVYMR